MKIRIKKHHILLSLGATTAAILPLAATIACGDSTKVLTADEAKVDAAKKFFTSVITKQTITTSGELALQPGLITASEINFLTGIKAMPNITATGATVTYTALVKVGLTQKINVTITAGSVTDKSISIVLTYSAHAATDQEKVTAAKNLFTPAIRNQVLTASVDHALNAGNNVNVNDINNLAGISHMPVISFAGVNVTYTALAVSGLTQTISVTIAAGAVTDTTIRIVLSFKPRIETPDEKITAAVALFTQPITTQTLSATIDSQLDHTAASLPVATINALAGITHMPDITSTGATVVYTAAAPNGLVQVVTATISATGGTTKTVAITLTFAPHVQTGDEKITAAVALFTQPITTQTLSATIDSKLDHTAASLPVATINALAGITHMPDITGTGATVVYTAAAPNGLVQVVTATISATGGTTKTVTITLTFAPHVQTGDEKITAAVALFTQPITTQTLSATIDSQLDHTAASLPVATINGLAGITHMPDITSTGATVVYTAAAPNGLVQVVTATISATGGTTKTVAITLTFAPHVQTGDEKITAAVALFTQPITTQTLSATIDSKLDHTAASLPVATINALAGITHMPDITGTGATVVYTAAAPKGLVQVVTATISATGGTTKTVAITLTFAPHVQTGDEKITAAVALFTQPITTQTLSATIDSQLDHTAASLPVATINGLAGITHMPDITSTGATVVYTAAAPNGLVQVVTATISATGGTTKTVTITLTFAPHVQTGDEKITAAVALFTQPITTQTLSATIDSKLDESSTDIPVATINGLAGITHMPDITGTGATVVYTAAAAVGLVQVVTATISATGGTTKTVAITLTFAPHVPTSDEKIEAAVLMFTPVIITQTVTTGMENRLDQSSTDIPVATINGLAGLTHHMPDISSTGATVVYTAVSTTNILKQKVIATISLAGGTTRTVDIILSYTMSVPYFESLYPGKLISNGTVITNLAFTNNASLPEGFILPETVEVIGAQSFSNTILPAGFTLPAAVRLIGARAFESATLPAGFALGSSATLERQVFHGAHLPAGFTIPLGITMVDTNSVDHSFYAVHLPAGYEWLDAQGNKIADQTHPTPGSVVAVYVEPTGDEKITAAVALFTQPITTQTLSATIDSKLDESSTDIPVATINGLAGITHMPDITSTGATVVYTAAAPNGLVQVVTATISATGGTTKTVTITLTFAPHVQTGDEKITAAVALFTQPITTQTLSATIDSKLDESSTDIPVATINGLAGITHMPDITGTGATVVYTAAAPNGLVQVVTATISATGGTTKTVTITLTFAPHVQTGDEKITAAVALFTQPITTQTLSATIDSKLDESSTDIPVATINGLAGITHMPDITSTGATVVYTAAAPNGLVQVVTATISATGGTTKTVTITLTFAPHVQTDAEKIQAAHDMFTSAITTQTISATITNKLDETATSIPVATINALTGITHMPDISGTGATVTYTATAPNGLVQVVTATISAGTAQSQTVSITLTFQPHIQSDAEKIQTTADSFTTAMRAQTLTAHIDQALAENETSAAVIDAALTTKLPTSLPSGVSVTYHVGAVDRATLIQNISVIISAGTATSNTFQISLTYAGITLAAFKTAYPSAISADGLTIVDTAFLSAKLPAGFALPETVTIIGYRALADVTFAGSFRLPSGVTTFGTDAFNGVTFPNGFFLPSSVSSIGETAFRGAVFPAGFTIPTSVGNIGASAFYNASLPAGFAIPATTTIVEGPATGPGTSPSFEDVFLPPGYEWHDAQGNKIADQTKPVPGCVVAPITP